MYLCKNCGNQCEFEEINVIKTYINQKVNNENQTSTDEFFYREDVICLNCNNTLEDGHIQEIPE